MTILKDCDVLTLGGDPGKLLAELAGQRRQFLSLLLERGQELFLLGVLFMDEALLFFERLSIFASLLGHRAATLLDAVSQAGTLGFDPLCQSLGLLLTLLLKRLALGLNLAVLLGMPGEKLAELLLHAGDDLLDLEAGALRSGHRSSRHGQLGGTRGRGGTAGRTVFTVRIGTKGEAMKSPMRLTCAVCESPCPMY